MKRTSRDVYFKKIRNLHKAMRDLVGDERTRFKKETGFTEEEDSRAIGRGLHKSENRHYTADGYGYKKSVQKARNRSICKSDRKDELSPEI